MPGRLTPEPLAAPAPGLFAALTRDRAVRLARAMPDCQSAVLLLLAWQATLHEKMRRGPLAGRAAASLSGRQLARMTGRPLRTVRHALGRLAAAGLTARGPSRPGRKNTYTLPFLAAGMPDSPGPDGRPDPRDPPGEDRP